MAFSKRQKTELGTQEFEINSLKKSSVQHKNELKHLGTVVINDLKNLKVSVSGEIMIGSVYMFSFSGGVQLTPVLDQEGAV